MILLTIFCVMFCLEFGIATPQENTVKESGFENEEMFIIVLIPNVLLNMNNDSKCPGPNEYYSCGPACDNVCATLHIQNQTHCPIVNIKCNDMCYCEKGYARDANKICVPFKKCQPSPVQQGRKRRDTSSGTEASACELDEEYKKCTCPPDTCISLVAKYKCGPCVPGCACRAGYLRQTADAPCRPMKECSQNMKKYK